MNRRKFLAFLGVAAAAPKVLAKVAEGMKKEEFLRKYPLTVDDIQRWFEIGDVLRNKKGQKGCVTSVSGDWCVVMPLTSNDIIGDRVGLGRTIRRNHPGWALVYRTYGEGLPSSMMPRAIKYKNDFQITK